MRSFFLKRKCEKCYLYAELSAKEFFFFTNCFKFNLDNLSSRLSTHHYITWLLHTHVVFSLFFLARFRLAMSGRKKRKRSSYPFVAKRLTKQINENKWQSLSTNIGPQKGSYYNQEALEDLRAQQQSILAFQQSGSRRTCCRRHYNNVFCFWHFNFCKKWVFS